MLPEPLRYWARRAAARRTNAALRRCYRQPSCATYAGMVINYRDIITVEPGKRGGRPCIRGMRITVGDILGWLAAGMSEAEIVDEYPELTVADIRASLAYAADRERQVAKPGFTDRWTGKFKLPSRDPSDER